MRTTLITFSRLETTPATNCELDESPDRGPAAHVRLRERWGDLMRRLNVDKVWRPLFAFQMVLLTEHRAIDIKENFDMTRMLLCSMALMVASRSKRHATRRQLLRVGRKGRKDTH
jgi:hypothetical protein